MSEESITKRLDQYKEKVKENFTVLVEKTFPEKILELNELLESEKFSGNRFDTIHSAVDVEPLLTSGGEKDGTSGAATSSVSHLTNKFMQWNVLHKLLPPEGRVTCNEEIKVLIDMVNRMQFELLQHTSAIKIAITYLVPKVEDGNNFGVEIQEESIKMIKNLESDFNSQWKSFTREYYKDRSSIANDICRDPHLDDNREGLRLLDQRAFLFLVNVVTFIRDAYAKIHDVITKNIEKIKKPRTSNADSLSN